MKSPAVLFDIGNVFVHWDPRLLYEKLIHDRDELDHFLENVVTLAWHTEHDRGKAFADSVAELSSRYPEYEDLIRAFDERWDETIGEQIDGTVRILEQLAEEGMRVYGLTNFSAEKWPAFCRTHAFTDLFDGVVVSGEVGLVKPDPRIFQIAVRRFELDPERTFYTDDRQENVSAAVDLGMVGHRFTTPALLEAGLRAEGFLY